MVCSSDKNCVKMSFGVLFGYYLSLSFSFSSFVPPSFLIFNRFYLFIVRFFPREQYSGRSFNSDITQKVLESRTGFFVKQDTQRRYSQGGRK